MVEAAHGQHAVEEVGASEEEVGGMESTHRASGGDELLPAVEAQVGEQLINYVVEPALVLLNAPAFVCAAVRPGLPVDTVHADDADAPGINHGGQHVDHAVVLPVIEASVLTGKGQHSLSVVSKNLIFHLSAEVIAPPFVIFYVHEVVSG